MIGSFYSWETKASEVVKSIEGGIKIGCGTFGTVFKSTKNEIIKVECVKDEDKSSAFNELISNYIMAKAFHSEHVVKSFGFQLYDPLKMSSREKRLLMREFARDDENITKYFQYIIMENAVGKDIIRTIENRRIAFNKNAVKSLGAQILVGLANIHGAGIVHRDLSYQNVIVGLSDVDATYRNPFSDDAVRIKYNRFVKIIDFGAAVTKESLPAKTSDQFTNPMVRSIETVFCPCNESNIPSYESFYEATVHAKRDGWKYDTLMHKFVGYSLHIETTPELDIWCAGMIMTSIACSSEMISLQWNHFPGIVTCAKTRFSPDEEIPPALTKFVKALQEIARFEQTWESILFTHTRGSLDKYLWHITWLFGLDHINKTSRGKQSPSPVERGFLAIMNALNDMGKLSQQAVDGVLWPMLLPIIGDDGIDLLKIMLAFDPEKRKAQGEFANIFSGSAQQLLFEHPFFKDLHVPLDPSITPIDEKYEESMLTVRLQVEKDLEWVKSI